jgi:hypothetical protein
LQRILSVIGVKTFKVSGFEDDDITGTLARIAIDASFLVKITSCDKDLEHLIDLDKAITIIKFDGEETELSKLPKQGFES